MKPIIWAISASLFLTSAPALHAQDTSSQLQSALDAYASGDLRAASLALTEARKALDAERGAKLAAVFPPAPDGWTLEVKDLGPDMAVMGGGAGVDANYTHSDGRYVTFNVMVDSPLVAGMMGTFAAPEMLAMLGEVVERPGANFVKQDSGLTGIVDGRMMVSVSASGPDVAMPIVELVDFEAMARFDAGS
ncbi:MAG: hypothetical protein MUD11_16345 [Rhodobacteraceae bacterium]|nr:hypothetical protein [Paracoccaceae bacterium]